MRLELLKHSGIINGNVKNSSQMIEKEGYRRMSTYALGIYTHSYSFQ